MAKSLRGGGKNRDLKKIGFRKPLYGLELLMPLRNLCRSTTQDIDDYSDDSEEKFSESEEESEEELEGPDENYDAKKVVLGEHKLLEEFYSYLNHTEVISHQVTSKQFRNSLTRCEFRIWNNYPEDPTQLCQFLAFSNNPNTVARVNEIILGDEVPGCTITEGTSICSDETPLMQADSDNLRAMMRNNAAPKLTKLQFRFAVTKAGDLPLRDFFRDLGAAPPPECLTSLDLSESYIGEFGALELAGILRAGKLSKLTALDLSLNQIEPRGARFIGKSLAAEACPELRKLNLMRNAGEEGMDAVLNEGLLGTPKIEALNVAQNNIEGRGLNPFSRGLALKKFTFVTMIDLSLNPLGDEAIERFFSSIPSFPVLPIRALALRDTGAAGGAAAAAGAALGRGALRRLRALDLGANRVDARGARELLEGIASGNCPDFSDLMLHNNRIGKDGLHAFANHATHGHLAGFRRLVLSANRASDVRHLVQVISMHAQKLPKLELLDVQGNDPSANTYMKKWKIKGKIQVLT